jgi:bifunctional DNA-binding transcriptional regulator/antitoxin component of YhaV-PrlF toxin-antitoxin module
VVRFQAPLKSDPNSSGTYVVVPRDVRTALGLKGKPKIHAVIAGRPYRGSLMPVGGGTYALGVLKEIQRAAGVQAGDTVTVDLEIDTAPRVIEAPDELAKALKRDPKAAAAWESLSYTNKKEMARSLLEAKKPETRERRLAAALQRLRR